MHLPRRRQADNPDTSVEPSRFTCLILSAMERIFADLAHRHRPCRLSTPRPPLPPYSEATARQKVLAAEAAWNTCDPDRVAAAYTEDSEWSNAAVIGAYFRR